jgi:hypothetical protein
VPDAPPSPAPNEDRHANGPLHDGRRGKRLVAGGALGTALGVGLSVLETRSGTDAGLSLESLAAVLAVGSLLALAWGIHQLGRSGPEGFVSSSSGRRRRRAHGE